MRPKDEMFATLDEAKAAAERENAAVKEAGKGQPRRVFKIEVKATDNGNPEVRGYVVHTVGGKARAVGAVAIGLTATDVDRPTRGQARSLVEQLATMAPDELDRVRKLLADLDAAKGTLSITPAAGSIGTHDAVAPAGLAEKKTAPHFGSKKKGA